jgi:hypothetical protein
MSGPSSSFGVGRFTALVLGLVVFVCVTMIGGTSYLKYRLDRAETTLAAPDNALADNQDLFGQLRQEWGFGGFLGLAQKYVFTHDASGLPEMKERIKSADAIVAGLSEKTSPQTRAELASIASLFDDALQKIEAPAGGELSNEVTVADLAPLYAAMPTLDARRTADNAEARFAAQNQAQFWAMLLTIASWFSLILAAACAAGIYLVLRDKQSAPLRALAQSIQNMAHGDMRTAIWGTERRDMIGELARALDLARYHFSHLPDLSLLSDEGPVRLRFEGGTRSLFEAMMKALSEDSENIHKQSSSLTSDVNQQKESIAALAEKVEAILRNIGERGQNGDKLIAQAIKEMAGGVENLKNSHAHAADQLGRLIPVIQDRAQGLAEITQITGKQLTHTLQSLASSEMSLKSNAEKSKETLAKLSSTADDLGARLFGAINLLQASGKVLGETTENIKSRWNDIAPVQDWSGRLDEIAKALSGLQSKLNAQTDAQLGLAKALEQTFEHNKAASDKAQLGIAKALEQGLEQSKTAAEEAQKSALAPLLGQLEQILSQLAALQAKLDEQPKTQAEAAQAPAPVASQDGLSAIGDKISELADLDGKIAVFVSALPGDMRQALREEIQKLLDQNTAAGLQEKLAALQEDMKKTLGASPELTGQILGIGKLLAARIDSQCAALDGKQQEIKAKLAELETSLASTHRVAEGLQQEMAKPAKPVALPPELQQQFLDQWFQMSAQIEASRASLAASVSEQLHEMEGHLAASKAPAAAKSTSDYEVQIQIEKQTEILGELVGTLGLLDAHMQQIKTEMHKA